VNPAARFLNSSEAAARLGISVKALRHYEQRGLLTPARTGAGWRAYAPDDMARAAQIVALRKLGVSLGQVKGILGGDARSLALALASHQASLEDQVRRIAEDVEKVRRLRADLGRGHAPAELARLLSPATDRYLSFDLPWPWGGERFELRDIRSLNYIVGPLGSGKTRLLRRIAEVLPAAVFLGWERTEDSNSAAQASLEADAALKSRVDRALAWLIDEGATSSNALMALVVGLESGAPSFLVIDMLEHGLDKATQEAVIAHLRRRGPSRPPIFCTTRSNAILDLDAVGVDEAIVLCPANHSPPTRVAPFLGAPGYEAVATCLGSPEVRARTEGVIAWRPAPSGSDSATAVV
jgi:DNA-binding transcriptional MerR regulator